MDKTEKQTSANPFHDHLDICKRCRQQPMNLCSIGSNLLLKATGHVNNPRHARSAGPDMFDLTCEDQAQAVLFRHVASTVPGPLGAFIKAVL